MRTNLPVSGREFVIPEGSSLVSTTDLQSRITYCNPRFIEVSGYTRDELYGQPHNMIRHPDMPSEAFRDMWATLQNGSPWSAMVKNRRKNGDHYWVMANATPLEANGNTVGYMSVRTKPTREQIDQAETLHTRMREEAQSKRITMAFRAGEVVRTGWRGAAQRMLRLTFMRRIWLTCAGLAVAGVLTGHIFSGYGPVAWPLGVIAAIGVSTLAALALGRRVQRPLQESIQFANHMAAGDISARVAAQASGEFGALNRALNQLNVNLQAVVADVRHEVEGVHVASGQIASGNHDLSARTESQANNLQETAASMEQLTRRLEQSASSALEASSLASRAANIARDGNTAMRQVITTMEDISSSSSRIGEIIQVIDGISFQTNILALNAAVEAARAGEQGRGFAVVAGEVRHLAQRTLTAAKEIKVLIDESAHKVSQGMQLVNHTGHTMGEVVLAVRQVSNLITEITGAASEQSTGIVQVNQSVGHLDSVTQQNAAMVEELAAAAASLQAQAVTMRESVRVFRLTEGDMTTV